MIDTIIFDFGDIFINLEYKKSAIEFQKLGLSNWNDDLKAQNQLFEIGKIKENEFLESFQKYLPNNNNLFEIKKAWNSILGEFPEYRLEFLQMLSQKYKLYLLSNTDAIHIAHFEENVGLSFAADFYKSFEKVYFSFEIGMRKPDEAIFKYVINNHNLSVKKTLFVDDKKENTDVAQKLGLRTWNLQVGQEDVINIFNPETPLIGESFRTQNLL